MSSSSNERLRKARQGARIPSSRQAALRFGWNYSTYASHENGQTPVPMEAAFRYGKAFGVSPIWILHGVGPKESLDAMLAGQPDKVWEEVRDLIEAVLKHRR